MTPCSLVEMYRSFAHLLLHFSSHLSPYRSQEFPKRHVWEDSTFNCVGDHNLRTYNIMYSSIKCSSYVCSSVRVSCAPNELVSVIPKKVCATSIHPQTHEPSPHTPQHDRHLPNAPLIPLILGSHVWANRPKTLSLPLPSKHPCWAAASTARCSQALTSHSDLQKLLLCCSSVCVGSGERRRRAGRRHRQLVTVMCWQQLGSDKYQHVHNNHNNKRVTRSRRMRHVWHVASTGSAKCVQNFSGQTWRKETTVSSRKARVQAVAYSIHTESSRGALAQLFWFKHVQNTTDKIALLWQQMFRGTPRCLGGQWRKHGRWHEQMHSHTDNQRFFWPELIVTWSWVDRPCPSLFSTVSRTAL